MRAAEVTVPGVGTYDVAELLQMGTATFHEAGGGIGALPSRIQAVNPGLHLVGTALPVRCAPGDNLALHEALAVCEPGQVIVAACNDAFDHGYFGEVMAVAAQSRGLAGLVIDGGVRDSDRLAALSFPAFSAGRCIRGTGKDPDAPRSVGEPVTVGREHVQLGDLVVADADGVVVIPRTRVADVVSRSRARTAREADQFAELRGGRIILDVLALPGARTEGAG